MKTEPISVRDFLRNFATITKKRSNKRYLIMKRNQPIGVFTPWEVQKKQMNQKRNQWIEEMANLAEPIGDGTLSQRVDEIVYGIKRDTTLD